MKRSSRQAIALACMLVLAGPAAAISVDNMVAWSAPGQPLRMDIKLVDLGAARAGDVRVRMASDADHRRFGLSRPAWADSVSFRVLPGSDGTAIVRATSSQPVDGSAVSYLVSIEALGQGALQQVASSLSGSASPLAAADAPAAQRIESSYHYDGYRGDSQGSSAFVDKPYQAPKPKPRPKPAPVVEAPAAMAAPAPEPAPAPAPAPAAAPVAAPAPAAPAAALAAETTADAGMAADAATGTDADMTAMTDDAAAPADADAAMAEDAAMPAAAEADASAPAETSTASGTPGYDLFSRFMVLIVAIVLVAVFAFSKLGDRRKR